jgi:uncharacterized protein
MQLSIINNQMIMKKVVLVLMFCLPAVVATGFSQTKQESIKEMFKLMKQDSLMEKTFNSIVPAIMSQMSIQNTGKDSLTAARNSETMKAVMKITKDVCKKMIDEDMVALYDKYFSQSDINDMLAFYRSPVGKKMIDVTPAITKDLVMIMLQKYTPEIQKLAKQKAEEMKAAGK